MLALSRSPPFTPGGNPAGFPVALTDREGGPLGGGGVAAVGVVVALLSFLLTHFLSTVSYSKEFASPRRALMGPRVCCDERSLDLPPPSQPPNHDPLEVLLGLVSF